MIEYSKYRKRIETGDLFFTAETFFFSRLIRFFTRSHVSHVGVFLWLGQRLFIVEAVEGKGVVMNLASTRFQGKNIFLGKIFHSIDQEEIINRSLSGLGKKYDLWGAISSLFKQKKDDQYFCSEYIAEVFGLLFPARRRGTTPDDIAALCGRNFIKLTFPDA